MDSDSDSDDDDDDEEEQKGEAPTPPVRRSTRVRKSALENAFAPMVAADKIERPRDAEAERKSLMAMMINKLTKPDPKSYSEAMASPDKDKWIEGMQEEINSLTEMRVFKVVPVPVHKKLLSMMWVFKKKETEKGEVERFKVRTCVRGCHQRKGIDYTESYAPVTRQATIRVLLSLAAAFKLRAR